MNRVQQQLAEGHERALGMLADALRRDPNIDPRFAEMVAGNIGPDVDARADVPTIQFLHDRLGQEFPVSGDDIARHNAIAPRGHAVSLVIVDEIQNFDEIVRGDGTELPDLAAPIRHRRIERHLWTRS